jgi:hypothetical protein
MSVPEQILREKAMEFWYEFDEIFKLVRFVFHYQGSTLYTDFKTEVEQLNLVWYS